MLIFLRWFWRCLKIEQGWLTHCPGSMARVKWPSGKLCWEKVWHLVPLPWLTSPELTITCSPSPFYRDNFWEWQVSKPRRMLQPRGWFYLFLFCQIECGFILGTSWAKRQWFSLAICNRRMIHTTPPLLGCRIMTWGWASIWSDQNAKFVHLPLSKAMEIPNLLTLPKTIQPTWSYIRWQSFFWLFLNNKAIRTNKTHRMLKDIK